MTHRIAQAFLNNAIYRNIDQGAKACPVRWELQVEVNPWMPLAPEFNQARDGGGQPEIGENSGAQAAEHCLDLPLHVGDRFHG